MFHIANIFIGKSLSKQSQSIAKEIYSSNIANHDSFDNYCRFFRFLKDGENLYFYCYNIDKRTNIFDDISFCESCDIVNYEDKILDLLQKIHTEMVTANTVRSIAELKLYVYINLCDKDSCDLALHLANLAKKINGKRFVVNFIAYDADIVHTIFDSDSTLRKLIENSKVNKVALADYERENDFVGIKSRFFVLQNSTNNGASLNLDLPTLNAVISEFILASLENYDSLFLNTITPGQITGIGLSAVLFDKKYFVRYLMRKAYISVLENEGIEQERVRRPEIEPIIQDILNPNIRVFSIFYDNNVKPLIQSNLAQDQIVAAVVPQLDAYFSQLVDSLLAFLSNEKDVRKGDGSPLTIPERRAALALLLNIDDELLEGTSFQNNILTIDDFYSEAAQVILNANNDLVTTTKDENNEQIRINPGPISNPLDENCHAIFPLKKLKKLKQDILTTTENIRKWEDQLQATEDINETEVQSRKRLTQNGFVYGDTEYRLLGKNPIEPLTVAYEPENVDIKKSVDLRQSFTPVKDQGKVGSCTTFSITAIYEYLLKKTESETPDLSERFVYYNTNIKDEPIQKRGSSFKDVIDAMKKYGICHEEECPYIIEEIEDEPTEVAYSKALNHKILEAKRVNVNHKDITSALSQGFPVAVCIPVYDSFGSGYKGFEFLPSQEEIDSKNYEYHSMVICGYSEDEHIYIVRNSWGESFGDKGYCYLPFSYIEDPMFQAVCCIVTRTLDGEIKGLPKTRTTVNFIKADNQILNILLKIKLEETKKLLQKLQDNYEKQRILFIQCIQTLETTSTRNNIAEGAKGLLSEKISELRSKQTELKGNFTKSIVETRKNSNFAIAFSSINTFIFFVLSLLAWWYLWDGLAKWIFSGIFGLGFLCTALFVLDKKHRIARKRNLLNAELGALSQKISNLENEKYVSELKFYLAGMIIDKISNLKKNLTTKYNHMISYTKNITTWYKEEKDKYEHMDSRLHIPMIGLIDNDKLDNYFSQCKHSVIQNIRFSDYLNEYKMGDDEIAAFKNKLRQTIIDRLLDIVNDFDIIRFIQEPDTYEFIDSQKFNGPSVIQQMDRMSEPFIQYQTLTGNIIPTKNLFCHDDVSPDNILKYFIIPPTCIKMEAKDKLVTITLAELEKESLL